MAESLKTKNMRDGMIELFSGVDTYTVAYEAGNLSMNVPGPTVSNYLDRGRFTSPPSLRYNEDQPGSGSFTARMRDISDATDLTLAEFILKSGVYSTGWTSSLGANEEVETVDMRWTVEGTDHGDAADHTVLWNYCVITGAIAEGDPNTITINWTSYDLYPTVT